MKFIITILLAAVLISCEKAAAPIPTISVNVINASPGVTSAKVQTSNVTGYYAQLIGVSSGSNSVFTIPVGGTVRVASDADTTKPLYSNTFSTGNIYSLFISGASGEDIILHPDDIPYHVDSTVGVRFVNLSAGANPISVNISGNADGSEINSLSYKGITEFKNYPATIDYCNSGYVFEFRDAVTGDLLGSYNTADFFYPAVPVYKNITLLLYGEPGNQQIMEINNF